MEQIHPIYKKLLIIALMIFVIGVGVMLSDLYVKVGKIEHALLHLSGKH